MTPEQSPESPFANSATTSIQEEAARVFKNNKSEHIKNYEVQGTRGESIGLVLIEMASKACLLFQVLVLNWSLLIQVGISFLWLG